MQKVSQLVQSNQAFNSNSYKNLSPVMKEAISDVMKLVEKNTEDLLNLYTESLFIKNLSNKLDSILNINGFSGSQVS